jgi:hypothetical protein
MNRVKRKTQVLIAVLLTVSAFTSVAGAEIAPAVVSAVVDDDDHGNSVAIVEATDTKDAAATAASKSTVDTPPESSLLPARPAHDGVLANLFEGHSWYTPPPPAPVIKRVKRGPIAPTAPTLPFSYIGRYERQDAATLYFLVKGDRVYDVKIGDVIEGMYSVDSVSNGKLMFTYLPLTSSQGLRLGDLQ